MKRNTAVSAILLAICVFSAWAQQSGGTLTEKQLLGRQLLAQSCGVCHLQASLNAKTYGPPLNKASANGYNNIMRTFILEGTPRMPGFKHYFKPADIDAIIDYVRTVPLPSDTSATR